MLIIFSSANKTDKELYLEQIRLHWSLWYYYQCIVFHTSLVRFQYLEKDFWVPPGYSSHHWLTSCHMGLTSSHIWCTGWSKSGTNVRKDLQSWEGSGEFTLQETGWERRKWESRRCSGCPDGDNVDLMVIYFSLFTAHMDNAGTCLIHSDIFMGEVHQVKGSRCSRLK